MTTYLKIGSILAAVVTVAWPFVAITVRLSRMFGREPLPAVRTIYHELRPLYLPAVIGTFVAASFLGHRDVLTYLNLGFGIFNWFNFRNEDDDDRWKRRRQRLAERVSVVAGRLTVVPVGAR